MTQPGAAGGRRLLLLHNSVAGYADGRSFGARLTLSSGSRRHLRRRVGRMRMASAQILCPGAFQPRTSPIIVMFLQRLVAAGIGCPDEAAYKWLIFARLLAQEASDLTRLAAAPRPLTATGRRQVTWLSRHARRSARYETYALALCAIGPSASPITRRLTRCTSLVLSIRDDRRAI